jgi:hypothetical protein
MSYRPIRSSAEIASRLIVGTTREDHWLDFKGLGADGRAYKNNDEGKRECRRDVIQFSNASGGTIVVGAVEQDHVLVGFMSVPDPQGFVRWIDEIVKEHTEPAPAIEPYVVSPSSGEELVAVNVPPALRLVGLRSKDAYEFPLRTADSRRYLRLSEIEARMQDQDRVHRLRLEQIAPDDAVALDATVERELGHNDWRVVRVGDDVVVLKKHILDEVPVPLAYIQTVYRAGLAGAEWVIDLDCYVSKHRQRGIVVVTKEMPHGRNAGHYRSRGMADE